MTLQASRVDKLYLRYRRRGIAEIRHARCRHPPTHAAARHLIAGVAHAGKYGNIGASRRSCQRKPGIAPAPSPDDNFTQSPGLSNTGADWRRGDGMAGALAGMVDAQRSRREIIYFTPSQSKL